jgi:glycosyltransferase involved in cell wall biosynthesis
MHKEQTVIISSISDCREKNGIVTFMEILARNSSRFADQGMRLTFANYVDLQPRRNSATPATVDLSAQPVARSTTGLLTRIKRRVKGTITRHPLCAFLLFLSTLGARGLVTALKARRYDRPDCVHFYQDFLTASFGCFLHDRTARRVLILHSGDDALSQLFAHFSSMVGTRYELLIRRWFEWTLRRQQAIVALSEKYAKDLRSRYPAQEVQCIYNTSPFAGTRSPSYAKAGAKERIRLVAVGTLQHRKGFDLLIKAIASIPHSAREMLAVTIVGGGPSHAELAALITLHQLSSVVTLAGESDNVAAFLSRSQAYILTSRDEGLPISLIEACSFGLPIISTAVGSIPELFDHSSCKLVEPTESSIAAALILLCNGKLDLENLSLRSQHLFQSKLSPEKFLDSYIRLLPGK